MSPTRQRSRPTLEPLEPKAVLSVSPLGAGTFFVTPGLVATPGGVGTTDAQVAQKNLPKKPTTLIGLTALPDPGSPLNPKVVAARGADGKPLPFHRGARYLPFHNPGARGYAKVATPGTLAVAVRGLKATDGPYAAGADLPGDVNGDGTVNLTDVEIFAKDYIHAKAGQTGYNPALDFNHNGQVGISDAKLLERNLQPLSPKKPLVVELKLAPGDQVPANGQLPSNSGGITYKQNTTILGHTTPGALVFADAGLGNYSFTGKVYAADAQGNFSLPAVLTTGINTFTFLAIDSYGQQTIAAFPVLWLGYGKYANAHPTRT